MFVRQVELRPGDLLCHRREPGPDPVVFRVLIVGPVRIRVLEVGNDSETPVALPQPQVGTPA